MNQKLQQDLGKYDDALFRARQTYKGMSADERAARHIAEKDLVEHAPNNRTEPTCTGCDGGPWPCFVVEGAIVMSNPHYN